MTTQIQQAFSAVDRVQQQLDNWNVYCAAVDGLSNERRDTFRTVLLGRIMDAVPAEHFRTAVTSALTYMSAWPSTAANSGEGVGASSPDTNSGEGV